MIVSNLINYLFYSSRILLPNNYTVCKGTEVCPIEWDIPIHAHIEVQMESNSTWSSMTDTGKSFLSVIVDKTSTNYEWNIPHYLTKLWRHPTRVVIGDLENVNNNLYSDNFTITGISIESTVSDMLKSETSVPIQWTSNDNNSTFGIYLINNGNVIDMISSPILPTNFTYYWDVPYLPELDLSIMVKSIDNTTYDTSDNFQIATTTSTTTTTSITTIGNNTTHGDPILHNSWYVLLIVFGSIITLFVLIYIYVKCCILTSKIGNKVHPYPTRVTGHGVQNPIYEGNNMRVPSSNNRRPSFGVKVLPPILPRIHTNNIYESPNQYSVLDRGHPHATRNMGIQYSTLQRD